MLCRGKVLHGSVPVLHLGVGHGMMVVAMVRLLEGTSPFTMVPGEWHRDVCATQCLPTCNACYRCGNRHSLSKSSGVFQETDSGGWGTTMGKQQKPKGARKVLLPFTQEKKKNKDMDVLKAAEVEQDTNVKNLCVEWKVCAKDAGRTTTASSCQGSGDPGELSTDAASLSDTDCLGGK